MKRNTIVRALWIAAAILAAGECWYVVHHFERRISAAQTSVETLYAMTSANERTIREAARLRAARDAARQDLARFGRAATLSSATAAVLEALDRQARAHHTTVTAVTPAAVPDTPRVPGLLAMPVTLRVRGRFRDMLGFLIDVAQRTPLVEIRRTQLARAQQSGGRGAPVLDGVIDATMYRFIAQDETGETHASAR